MSCNIFEYFLLRRNKIHHIPTLHQFSERKGSIAKHDKSQATGKDAVKNLQTVTGTFNWYRQGFNGTLLIALSALTSKQSKPTTKTMKSNNASTSAHHKRLLNLTITKETWSLHLTARQDQDFSKKARHVAKPGDVTISLKMSSSPSNKGAILNIKIIIATMSWAAEAKYL